MLTGCFAPRFPSVWCRFIRRRSQYYAQSPYYTLNEPGETFSTSLYGLGQVGYTREQYHLRVIITKRPIIQED
jgi:hypothetical protein